MKRKIRIVVLLFSLVLFSLGLLSTRSSVAYANASDGMDDFILIDSNVATRSFQFGNFSKLKKPVSTVTSTSYQYGEERLASMAVVGSPARCTGRTDFPHKSGNYASVHSRIRCNFSVTRLETVTTLTRDRWYGVEAVKTHGSYTTGSSTSNDAHPHYYCKGTGTYTYRGYSQHASLENGRIYRATTSNWQVPGISRFKC